MGDMADYYQAQDEMYAEEGGSLDEPTSERKTKAKASSNTPTALSSIDEVFPTWFKKLQVTFSGRYPESADETQQVFVVPYNTFKVALEAHIAEHYVPKTEVKGLDKVFEVMPKLGQFPALPILVTKEQYAAVTALINNHKEQS